MLDCEYDPLITGQRVFFSKKKFPKFLRKASFKETKRKMIDDIVNFLLSSGMVDIDDIITAPNRVAVNVNGWDEYMIRNLSMFVENKCTPKYDKYNGYLILIPNDDGVD